MTDTAPVPSRRKPWLAALLSLFLPGLGHLYAGRVAAALGWAVGFRVVSAGGLLLVAGYASGAVAELAMALLTLGFLAPMISAWHAARSAPGDYLPGRANRWESYLGMALLSGVLGLSARAVIRTNYQAFHVISDAMKPTLLAGDVVFARQLGPWAAAPTIGEVITFQSLETPGVVIVKRVVGVAGDTVAMEDGLLFRNGQPVAEPYTEPMAEVRADPPEAREQIRQWQLPRALVADTATYHPDRGTWGPLVVPPESLFVLGDNRNGSYDSRYYGWVGVGRVLGKPTLIYYSYDEGAFLPLPVLTAVRWARLGTRLSR